MTSYAYVAIDASGSETRGTIKVENQLEAVRRIKQMGLFPTKVLSNNRTRRDQRALSLNKSRRGAFPRRVPNASLTAFTRQTATLLQAGMPLLRGLRILRDQEEHPGLRHIIDDLSEHIESGGTLAEALAAHPRIFNALYINMVRAGEMGGSLDLALARLAEFMEKARRVRNKVKAAMFYPVAVLIVAAGILVLLMGFIVPRFEAVFEGLMHGQPLPTFTRFVLGISSVIKTHTLELGIGAALLLGCWTVVSRTRNGRTCIDRLKLSAPGIGAVWRKLAISRFARTLGTLSTNGVPILQSLTIARETAGNVLVERVIARIHERVKQGDPIAPTLRESGIFPPLVAGMVDVGEQTGALPDMLLKVADTYDEDVDNATSAMTSLIEPIMIVFLAVVVGSIVIAMFLPLISIITDLDKGGPKDV